MVSSVEADGSSYVLGGAGGPSDGLGTGISENAQSSGYDIFGGKSIAALSKDINGASAPSLHDLEVSLQPGQNSNTVTSSQGNETFDMNNPILAAGGDGKGDGKGNKFRGGKQTDRDGDLSQYPEEFVKWYHRNARNYKLPGQPDPDLESIHQEWKDLGEPTVKFTSPFLPSNSWQPIMINPAFIAKYGQQTQNIINITTSIIISDFVNYGVYFAL